MAIKILTEAELKEVSGAGGSWKGVDGIAKGAISGALGGGCFW